MPTDAAEARKMTPAEYVAWEETQVEKHELLDGVPYAMSGASPRHNKLAWRLTVLLDRGLSGTPCEGLDSNQRIAVANESGYVYPDASIVCGNAEFDPVAHGLLNPAAIFEVLSRSTEAFDRGDKARLYRARPSLRDYVLVSQWEALVEQWRLLNGVWTLAEAGPGQAFTLADGTRVAVDELYEGVWRFPTDEDLAKI